MLVEKRCETPLFDRDGIDEDVISLIEKGIIMAGGGALLRGFDKLIQEETGLPVHVTDDPLTAVALGTGKVLSELRYLKKVVAITHTLES